MRNLEDVLKHFEPCEASEKACEIIDVYEETYEKLKKDYGYTEFDVETIQHAMDIIQPGITILHIMGCLKPESICYGKAVGFFIYKDYHVFRFHYNIHTPEFNGPRVSNMMEDVEEIILDEKMRDKYDILACEFEKTGFGSEAFWAHTPISTLKEDEKALRALMMALQAYCRKQEYCKLLRKLDKKHLKWEAELKMRLNSDVGVHPALKQMENGKLPKMKQ